MFKFLKDKLKSAISSFGEKVELEAAEKAQVEQVAQKKEAPKPQVPEEKKGFFSRLKEKFSRDDGIIQEPVEKLGPEPKAVEAAKPRILPAPKKEPPKPAVKKERVHPQKVTPAEPLIEKKHVAEQIVKEPAKGIFQRIKEKIQTVTISEEKFLELFWELEVVMLENNVAVEVIDTIRSDLKKELVDKPIARGSAADAVGKSLARSVRGLFAACHLDVLEAARAKKPYVICFVGVNGSGKTTTIAKVARLFQASGLSVVLAAADTFRAAAIDQLQLHADRLNVKLIRHDYGSDAAAVAFDAIRHAESKNKDVVLIDTAGRMHSNANLMDEMKKLVRVAKPDLVVFIGEAITGNDCVEQAKMFSEAVQIDAIILSKADVDEKGGAAISISKVTSKPIIFLGTGQNYDDLKPFDPDLVVRSLGLEA